MNLKLVGEIIFFLLVSTAAYLADRMFSTYWVEVFVNEVTFKSSFKMYGLTWTPAILVYLIVTFAVIFFFKRSFLFATGIGIFITCIKLYLVSIYFFEPPGLMDYFYAHFQKFVPLVTSAIGAYIFMKFKMATNRSLKRGEEKAGAAES